ncbi:MAG: hypothetical protein HOK97_11020 [Deltaproteobacteria bacterium]|jgi:hypothetical protein|nr:hypothetical protein [Deltaproteobacteria bacterium]MBT6490285.1 hypothetical protein [Deltaproteobacteria bacterium]
MTKVTKAADTSDVEEPVGGFDVMAIDFGLDAVWREAANQLGPWALESLDGG